MSMHKQPCTPFEELGLHKHGLAVGKPSQLSDCFRLGMQWAARGLVRVDGPLCLPRTIAEVQALTNSRLGAAQAIHDCARWLDQALDSAAPRAWSLVASLRTTSAAMRQAALALKTMALIDYDRYVNNDARDLLFRKYL